MDIHISITNSTFEKDMNLINGSKIKGNADVDVTLDGIDVKGTFALLENIEFDLIEKDLKSKLNSIDKNSREYKELAEILSERNLNKKTCLEHLIDFSQGVLASIIANYITRI